MIPLMVVRRPLSSVRGPLTIVRSPLTIVRSLLTELKTKKKTLLFCFSLNLHYLCRRIE